jgi:hypothetical protein
MLRFTSTLFGVVLLLALVPAYGQDFQKGRDAYNSGDYATALKEWRPMAEQGVARAQLNLGYMYDYCEGVPEDDVLAARLYRLAAEPGLADAQNDLGVMYGAGEGVPKDYALAYIWWNLAAAQGEEYAVKNRDIVARNMTPAQIAEAQRMAREWWEAHQ